MTTTAAFVLLFLVQLAMFVVLFALSFRDDL